MTATCAFMNKQFFPCNIRTKQKNEQQVDRKRRCNTWLSSQQPVLLPYLKLDENTRFIDQSKEQFIKKQDMTVNQCGHHLSSVTLNNPSSKRVRSEPLDGTYDHPTTHIGRIYLPPNTFPVTVQSIKVQRKGDRTLGSFKWFWRSGRLRWSLRWLINIWGELL